jgi:hypothetical protein
MSLEQQISELNATIKTLNENILLLLGSKEQHSKVECSPVEPVNLCQTEQQTFLPEVAKSDEYTREQLQSLCLEANRDIIKAIMLSNFEARKTGDLADNQINLCYSMIAQATKDD